jgi:hypothetical protein
MSSQRGIDFFLYLRHPLVFCVFTSHGGRQRLKCDGTRAETRFRLSTKRTSPFKSAGASFQSTTGRRAVHISLQGFYCSCKPVFCSHVTLTGYPLHSIVSPSLLLPCVTVCHHISNAVYQIQILWLLFIVFPIRWILKFEENDKISMLFLFFLIFHFLHCLKLCIFGVLIYNSD